MPKFEVETLLGSGAAKQGANVIKSQAYRLYVREAVAMGETPLTEEEWKAQQQQQQEQK